MIRSSLVRLACALAVLLPIPLCYASPAMAAVSVSSTRRAVSPSATAPPGYVIEAAPVLAPQSALDTGGSVSCPAGTATWGGGSYFSAYSPPVSINTSEWNGAVPGGWVVRLNNPQAYTAHAGVEAVCAKKPRKYTLAYTRVDDPAGAQAGGVATCPTGTVLLSGGVGSTADAATVYLTSARPISARKFRAYQQNGSSSDQPFFVQALCAAKPPGYARTSASSTIPAPSGNAPNLGFAAAACPTNTSAIGGGFGVSPPNPAVIPYSSSPETHEWDVSVDNTTTAAQTFTAYAICAA